MELQIKELSHSYGNKKALDGFSWTFRPGITALLGPNGAGKSTLIKLICDIIKRQKGEILYNGKDIHGLGKGFRKVLGFMPQDPGVYATMTARGFLSYIAELKGLSGSASRDQIEKILTAVGLKDAADRRLGGFSGGMRQRVMLAQSLLGDPKVLLLDEPTAGLDPEERVRLRDYIKDLSEEKIVVITTHVTTDVEGIADSILLINSGRLIASGSAVDFISGCGATDLEEAYFLRLHGEGAQ